MKPYGKRLPRFGPANNSTPTRFQEVWTGNRKWEPQQFFERVVAKIGYLGCDYVNAKVTFADGWSKPAAGNDVPVERMEWCYELPFGGVMPAAGCYVASRAEVAGDPNLDAFSAKYTGWQFWTGSRYLAKNLETKGAARFNPDAAEFSKNPVPLDEWYKAIMDRLDPDRNVPIGDQRMASFTVHVYSGQKLADHIASGNGGSAPPP